MEEQICKNCNLRFRGHYCYHCGQSGHEGRIDANWLLHDVPHSIFHIDKGFFYTLKSLFTRPGNMIQEYLEGKRVRHFRPFAYVVLMTTLCSFIIKALRYTAFRVYYGKDFAAHLPEQGSFFANYFTFFIFIMIPFAAVITWLTFFRRKYNFWEHFLINTYLAAQLNLLLVMVNIVLLTGAFFSIDPATINVSILLPIFMTGFLFLYGYTFGVLMSDEKKKTNLIRLSLFITLMNFLLFAVYFLGVQLTGVF